VVHLQTSGPAIARQLPRVEVDHIALLTASINIRPAATSKRDLRATVFFISAIGCTLQREMKRSQVKAEDESKQNLQNE
jgi:hypothetical protein